MHQLRSHEAFAITNMFPECKPEAEFSQNGHFVVESLTLLSGKRVTAVWVVLAHPLVLLFLPVMTGPCRTSFTSWCQASKKVSVTVSWGGPGLTSRFCGRQGPSSLPCTRWHLMCWSRPSSVPCLLRSGSAGHLSGHSWSRGADNVYLYLKSDLTEN